MLELTPPLIRHLYAVGRGYAEGKDGKSCESLYFHLGLEHPVFEVFPRLFPREEKAYAWYVRVPDVPGFLEHIRPVLQERLARSQLSGYSGEVKVGFYTAGIKLILKEGCFETIEAWRPMPDDEGQVRFPDLTFLSLLCGRRSFDELADFFPDCYATKDEFGSLMRALFPKQTSNVWGLV
jgi:hypothetical protein